MKLVHQIDDLKFMALSPIGKSLIRRLKPGEVRMAKSFDKIIKELIANIK